MADEYLEREVKYDVPADFVVPSLDGIADGETDEKSVQLNSVYFDTEHRDLLARGITLRCRTGTTDNGWQLKVPAGADRTEIRLDPTGNQRSAPAELADLVKGVRRGKPLRHIVTVRTDRTVHTVRSVDKQVVAEVADDRALAVTPGRRGLTLAEWREVEAELGPAGTDRILPAIDDRLTKAGAVASTAANKVARALGRDPDLGSKDKKRARTAGDVILRYLVEQDDALLIGDLDLRRGFGAIHPTRVATRRLRSTLRIFSDYVDAARAEAFDAELSWYAELLGNVRDREVQRARFAEAIAELPDVDGAEAAGRQLEEQLLAEQQHHRAILDKALSGRRYVALLQESARWIHDPPFTDKAGKKPATLRDPVRSAAKKVAKHLKAGLRSGNEDELHRARKAAKRARYAAELAHGVVDKKLRKSVKDYQELQDILGEHQDSAVAADVLNGLAELAPKGAFVYGLLYAHELDRAEKSQARAESWGAARSLD